MAKQQFAATENATVPEIAGLVLAHVRTAAPEKQARLLKQGANVVSRGALEEQLKTISDAAKADNAPLRAALAEKFAAEAKAAEDAKKAALTAAKAYREATAKAEESAAIKANARTRAFEGIDAVMGVFGLPPVQRELITVKAKPASPSAATAAALNSQ